MKTKQLTDTQYIILYLVIFCIFLQTLRVFLTQSLSFSFLIWNVVLAVVPYGISEVVIYAYQQKKPRLTLFVYLALWLLFLPNAPYIITDFVHLPNKTTKLFWYDLFMLFSFASTGVLLGIMSLININNCLKQLWSKTLADNLTVLAMFLSGFGVYLGRFLRFNSWDIFISTSKLCKDILKSINQPSAWYVTLGFGCFMWLLFLIFKNRMIQERSYTN